MTAQAVTVEAVTVQEATDDIGKRVTDDIVPKLVSQAGDPDASFFFYKKM